jgi:hypothetical protein
MDFGSQGYRLAPTGDSLQTPNSLLVPSELFVMKSSVTGWTLAVKRCLFKSNFEPNRSQIDKL